MKADFKADLAPPSVIRASLPEFFVPSIFYPALTVAEHNWNI